MNNTETLSESIGWLMQFFANPESQGIELGIENAELPNTALKEVVKGTIIPTEMDE